MHIKYLAHGEGSTRAAVKYLLGEKDHKKEVRETIEVLRGNPDIVADLGDSLKFKHKYRSAVISWAREDNPTAEQKQEVLDEFERLAFAGLEPDQYHFLAVDHGDHIHIISPRVELSTGKSMNIAAPGWQKVYDPLRDYFNEKYGWKSPDIDAHPENARLVNLSSHNIPKSVKKAKEAIHAAALAAVQDGLIENREDMENWLRQFGELTRRKGAKSISVKPDGFKKALKMEGAIYERAWKTGREDQAEAESRDRSSASVGEKGAGYFYGELERIIDRRSSYNQKRYANDRGGKQEVVGEVVGEAIAADIGDGKRVHQGDRIGEEESQKSLLGNHSDSDHIDITIDSDSNLYLATEAEPDGMESSSVGARSGEEVDLNRGRQQKGNTDRNFERERGVNDRARERIKNSFERTRRELQIKLEYGNSNLRREHKEDSGERRARLDRLDRASVQINGALRFYRDTKSVNIERAAARIRRRKLDKSVIAHLRKFFREISDTVKIDFGRAIAETIKMLAKRSRMAQKQTFNRWGSGMKM